MIRFRIALLRAKIQAYIDDWLTECPREKMGYSCHRNSRNYNYTCEECGRSSK